MNGKILFVDDEMKILKALTRLFRDEPHEIITMDSPLEALKVAKEQNISLVVSDMRMPLMNGYEFLKKIREIKPECPRIILSGFIDQAMLEKAIEEKVAQTYILKPWKNDELLKVLNEIFLK